MKTFFISAFIVCMFQIGNAQKAPDTPETPTNIVANHGNYSEGGNTSVSISHTDDAYKLKASFPQSREARLKELIQNTLGDKNLNIRKGYSKWSNNEKVYEVKLTQTTLRIWIDLNIASTNLIEKFEALGHDAKTIISGSNINVEKARMQREADRMRREANRMQQEVKRLEQQAARETKRVEREMKQQNERVQRDAKRLEIEAKRLDMEAKRVEKRARHKGGISSYIKRLLDDAKTIYTGTSGSDLNWIWPSVQEDLLAAFLEDEFVTSTSKVAFTAEKDHMYVDGVELTEAQSKKYSAILRKAGIKTNADFSFYKKGDHIVIIGLNAKIKKTFNDLYKQGFIASTDEAVKLLINGNSIVQNGTNLSSDKVAAINTILSDNGIIPAPGKYLEMKKAGSYRLGYSTGTKGIVGTWIEED
ncbi:hypothetical protein H2O64_06795 [Kordia sp. YSTF-M3]|uniref:Uncharacterized protein n=1 Tax=Kordia aestuariivivens TaxID=2759037 RepID=A0ABR7Q770_9FLAO|nr:hypothetical protein [Kordia aestuariivivens]MBC8754372.1 hypothetical protein [Kordia aestuariivivens]